MTSHLELTMSYGLYKKSKTWLVGGFNLSIGSVGSDRHM